MKKTTLALTLSLVLFFSALFMYPVQAAQWSTPTQIATAHLYLHVSPSITADGSKIAFSAWVGDNTEIFVVNSNGTGLKQLTSNSRMDAYPTISADGSKIVFISFTFWDPGSGDPLAVDYQLFVMNSDGTELTRLTTMETGFASISGDGSKIAYCCDGLLYVVNSDGTGLAQLTNGPNDFHPSISSDGSKIAFVSKIFDADPLVEGHDPNDDYEVVVINSDGTGRRQLTFNFSIDYYDTYPSITSDGNKVAFSDWLLYMVNSDGTELTQLTSNEAVRALYPSTTSNGSKIAFSSEESNEQGTTVTYFVVNGDATDLVNLGSWSYQSIAGGSRINEDGNTIAIPLFEGIFVSSTATSPAITPTPSASPSPSPTPTPTFTPTPTPTLISEPEAFPTTLVIGSVIAVAAVGLSLLVYFKKRKH